MSLNIVSRVGILAEPRGYLSAASRPATGLLVHHSVTYSAIEHKDCPASWKHVQSVAFTRGFTDVSYHNGICRHGVIFEGRKADRGGAHCDCSLGHNRTHYGAVLIGNYENEMVTPEQESALAELADYLGTTPTLGHFPRLAIWPHRKYKATACSGKNSLPIIDRIRAGTTTPTPPTPPPPTTPPPYTPPAKDWTEEVILALPMLDLRNANNSAVRHYMVDNLQGLIAGARIPCTIDGIAGGGTKQAVMAFQTKVGLHADAMVGKDTWTKLINY